MYLTRTHFYSMFGAAALIHLVLLFMVAMMPGLYVKQVPIRALNIKLGAGDFLLAGTREKQEADPMNPMAAHKPRTVPPKTADDATPPEAVVRPQRKAKPPIIMQQRPAAVQTRQRELRPRTDRYAAVGSASPSPLAADTAPSQYTRGDGTAGRGSPDGNSTDAQAEIVKRYEQVISIWIKRQRHYVLQVAAQEGRSGRVSVRMRINRQGHILYFHLEQSTGSAALDNAVAAMIQAANPVPPTPMDYPGRGLIEFIVPVNYSGQSAR